jgi:hypothetical protein
VGLGDKLIITATQTDLNFKISGAVVSVIPRDENINVTILLNKNKEGKIMTVPQLCRFTLENCRWKKVQSGSEFKTQQNNPIANRTKRDLKPYFLNHSPTNMELKFQNFVPGDKDKGSFTNHDMEEMRSQLYDDRIISNPKIKIKPLVYEDYLPNSKTKRSLTFEQKVKRDHQKNIEYQKSLEKDVLRLKTKNNETPCTYIKHVEHVKPKNQRNNKQKTPGSEKTKESKPAQPQDASLFTVMKEDQKKQKKASKDKDKIEDTKTFGYALPDTTPYYPWGVTHLASSNLEYITVPEKNSRRNFP